MSEIAKKVIALQEAVKKEAEKDAAAARRMLLVYAALVVFVAGYSLFLTTTIRREATPHALAILFLEQARESLPKMFDGVDTKMEKNAQVMATKTVQSIYHVIPQVTEMAKVQCDLMIDQQLDNIEATYMPKVKEHIKASMEGVIAHRDIGKNKDLAKALTVQVVEELDREAGVILSREFYSKIDDLTAEIKKLRVSKVSSLTNRQYAERMMIINWLYLTNHGRNGSGVMASLLSSTTEAFLDFYKLEKLKGGIT